MPRISAGLLMYRRRPGGIEVLLVHPGGPYFRNKDEGHWSIPKGEVEPGEPLVEVARREFEEEVGYASGDGPLIELSPITQKRGKIVHAWAIEGDCDPSKGRSNTFTMEWPPGSGRMAEFPEVDRAEFFPLDQARRKIKDRQSPLLDELVERLGEAT
jgi:predicted NUDIX family NTP pyrophosphohydrolase